MTNQEKFGGNLEGIRQRLSYLQELGITGIYLNPIMKAESNHKYDTTDYTKIDPFFGDADTMKALCKEAHEKGIRIMVDAVFNHSGRKFEPWIDILEHGKRVSLCGLVYGRGLGTGSKKGRHQRPTVLFLCIYRRDAKAEYKQRRGDTVFL